MFQIAAMARIEISPQVIALIVAHTSVKSARLGRKRKKISATTATASTNCNIPVVAWQRRGSAMSRTQDGRAKARPELLLPRHAGDAVRLAAAAAILLLSAELVDRNRVHVLEVDAFRLVNDLPGALYPLVWAVMQLGNVLVVPVLAGAAALTRRYRLAVNLAVAGFGCWALAKLVKDLVQRGRPAQYLPDVNFHGPPASGLGYISGHAAVAVALASVASPYLGRRARRVAWALAAAVCLSRL